MTYSDKGFVLDDSIIFFSDRGRQGGREAGEEKARVKGSEGGGRGPSSQRERQAGRQSEIEEGGGR